MADQRWNRCDRRHAAEAHRTESRADWEVRWKGSRCWTEEHIPRRRVGDALRVGIIGRQGEARRGVLVARSAARGGRVLVDLLRAAVHDPDVAYVARVDRDAGRAGVGSVDGPTALRRTRNR